MDQTKKELKQVPASMLKFKGTPLEIGGEIWERMCLPAVKAVGNQGDAKSLAQLYAGIFMAGLGAMTADFGHPMALAILGQMQSEFANMANDPEFQGSKIQ